MHVSMTPESKLNFFPQYEGLLKSRTKSATARLGDIGNRFQLGQRVTLTIGWDRDTGKVVANGTIKELFVKRVKEITERDLDGESPDCLNKEALKYVLSSIYRTVVNDDDYVSIIKWRYE